MSRMIPPLVRSLVRRSIHSLVGVLTIAPMAMAGSLIVVDTAGTADYDNIQDAVTVSQPGDLILVLHGEYEGFTIADKSVHIAAVDGAVVTLSSTLIVRNIPPTAIVALQGLSSTGGYVPYTDPSEGFIARNSHGSIRINECQFKGFDGSGGHGAAALLDRCDDIVFTSSSLTSLHGGSTGHGLLATESNLGLFRTTIRGAPSSSRGADGVHLSGSDGQLFATGCVIEGGYGFSGSCPEWGEEVDPGDGGHGLVNEGWSSLVQDSVLAGGYGGAAARDFPWCYANDGTSGQPSVGPIVLLPGVGRALEVGALLHEESGSLNLTFHGQVGDHVYLGVSLGADFELSPRHDGPRLLASPYLGILHPLSGGGGQLSGGFPLALQSPFLGVIDATGSLSVQIPLVPGTSVGVIKNAQLQGTIRDSNGALWMTDGRTVSVVPRP